MKDVNAVLPPPVQVLDPLTEDSPDELHITLVPAQEDELPQGVLELVASLIARHQPAMENGHAVTRHSLSGGQQMLDVERGEGRSPASTGVLHPQVSPLAHQPVPRLKPQLISLSVPAPAPSPWMRPMTSAITVEPALVERPSSSGEPQPVDRTDSPSAPWVPAIDSPVPDVSLNLQTAHRAPRVAQAAVPFAAMVRPLPAIEAAPQTLAAQDRGLLQVPFNSSAASGQVTISRMADEPGRNLLLSPSNTLVFEQIRAALELARDPVWQLTDNDGEQQGRGSHQPPDEEQAEPQDLPA